MSDALRSHEVANALLENERAVRACQTAAHRGFTILEENTRELFALTSAVSNLAREVAEIRIEVAALTAAQATLVALRKDELALERDKVEITEHGRQAEREHADRRWDRIVNTLRDGARGAVTFLQTRAGGMVLVLCGMVIAWLMGTDEFSDLVSNLLALSKGWRATP